MKKYLLSLVVMTLLGLVSGCGGGSSSDTTNTDDATAQTNEEETTAEVVGQVEQEQQAEQQIIANGITYLSVTSPYTGKIWLDRNLGATQICTSFDDEACYGDLYQWGRDASGHEKRDSALSDTQATTIIETSAKFITSIDTRNYDWAYDIDKNGDKRVASWSSIDGTSICPVGYRVPNITELKAETIDVGVKGKVDAFNNFLKLPASGHRNSEDGSVVDVGEWGDVWSVTTKDNNAQYIRFFSDAADAYDYHRAYGFSVRCIKN